MPVVYGIEHILYLIIVITIMTFSLIFIKKYVKNDKQLSYLIKFIGVLLLGAIVFNRVSIAVGRDNIKLLWPTSFCGTSSFVLALTAIFFKKNNSILHCVGYLGFLGGLITLIYPDFIGQADSIFYPMTISGLLHHTIMLFLTIVMFMTGYIQPSIKKWKYMPIGLSYYICYGIFLITVIGLDNAMNIFSPILSDTILNWFFLGLIFIPVQFCFLLIWEFIFNSRKMIKSN